MKNPANTGFSLPYGRYLEQLEPYNLRKQLDGTGSINLGSNENHYGCSPRVHEALSEALGTGLHFYPDPAASALVAALSELYDIGPDRILPENGSDLILLYLISVLRGEQNPRILSSKGTFQSLRVQANIAGVPVDTVPLVSTYGYDLKGLVDKSRQIRPSMIYICNPNNPTGVGHATADIEACLDALPTQSLVVLDEAYAEYASVFGSDYQNSTRLLELYPNLVILRTFSKAYGLAGLRVGYALGHPRLISILRKIKTPFSPSSLSICGAIAAAKDQQYLQSIVETNRVESQKIQQTLRTSDLWDVSYSVTNFVFLNQRIEGVAEEFYEFLLGEGIIVRRTEGMELPGGLRITVGTPDQNKRLIAATEKYWRQKSA